MHSFNSSVDSELFRMWHWTVVLIEINAFNLRTPICAVTCKKIHASEQSPSLILGAMSELRNFFTLGKGLIEVGAERRQTFMFFSYLTIRSSLHNCLWGPLKPSPIFFGVGGGYLEHELQDVKLQVWLDQIWSESLQDLFFVSSSFCIDWYWSWIFPVEFDYDLVHQIHLELW